MRPISLLKEIAMAVKRAKSRLEFILQITDYFKGHWEDPEWGRRPSNQVLIALAVRELAQGIQDSAAQKQITEIADRTIAKNAAAVR
jgi:hypothetical protein